MMDNQVCDQCSEPATMFIGSEHRPKARFCPEHGRKLVKANLHRRGAILASIARRRRGRLAA